MENTIAVVIRLWRFIGNQQHGNSNAGKAVDKLINTVFRADIDADGRRIEDQDFGAG